jgi:hypothetical protein
MSFAQNQNRECQSKSMNDGVGECECLIVPLTVCVRRDNRIWTTATFVSGALKA